MKRPSARWAVTALVSLLLIASTSLVRVDAQADPSVVGQWSGVNPWPCVAVHTALLPNGKVFLHPRNRDQQAQVWTPSTNTFTFAPQTVTDLFCSGLTHLADGRLFIAGGHIQDGIGLAHSNVFNYLDNSWTRMADMNAGRWYPTATRLANGDILVASGSIDNSVGVNRLPQVWSAAGGGWRNLTTAELSLPLYPMMFLAPNGKVFNAGPGQTSRYLDTAGTGSWSTVGSSALGFRDTGAAVLYDAGKIMMTGGHDPPTATTEVINLSEPAPAWRTVDSMAFARRQMNLTLLPDGSVLATGGTSGGGFNNAIGTVFAAERWDPETEEWSTLASMAVRRLYHSTAILLPDGRVLSAGGGQPAASGGDSDHLDMELYSPPYLFKGARPAVTSAPGTVTWGQTFTVQTPDAASIAKLNLIALGATTHTVNMGQRLSRLPFTIGAGVLQATAPPNGSLCPPGYYMLFAVNQAGVPSVGRMIRVSPPTTTVPAAPTNLTAAPGSSSRIELAWKDNAINEEGFKLERMKAGGTWSQFTLVGANTAAYSDRGLTPSTTYSYRVRAYNSTGNSSYSNTATATTSAAPPPGTGTGLTARYFNNVDLTGIQLVRTDPILDFDWHDHSPDPLIDHDTFSARWTGQVQAQYSETYTFTTTSDDGVRVWVNNVLVIDNWTDHAPTDDSGSIALTAGQKVSLKVEYFENGGGAVAKLFWSSPSQDRQIIPKTQLYPEILPGTGLKGSYFNNKDLTGLKFTRTDATVNFNWGSGSPASSIDPNTFSVRWAGFVMPSKSGVYTIYTTSDDGVRVWLHGTKIISNWTKHTATEDKATVTLQAGVKYPITVEYFDGTGVATISLSWSSASVAKEIIPRSQLYR